MVINMNASPKKSNIFNLNTHPHVISPNPPTEFNKISKSPTIDSSSFIGPFSSIIGDVTIDKNVFIACNVVVRCDEGSPFFIGENSNLQDGVILHGLARKKVLVNNKKYSIYIGKSVSCAHGSIIHGPCFLNDDVFVGFNSTVFYAIVGKGTYISSNCLITGGIKIESNKFVPPGSVIDSQEKADILPNIPKNKDELAKNVQEINNLFPYSYSTMFGEGRCSCGLHYNLNNSDIFY